MSYALPVAAAQPQIVSGDLSGNVARHAEAVEAADARVVVFPELSLTGYELEADAVLLGDPALAPLTEVCVETGSLALAGAPIQGVDGHEHIAMLAFDAEGVRVVYHKMWLGEAEVRRFRSGLGPAMLLVDGWRLGLAICKDTGIAEHAASTATLGMDIYVAGVLESVEDTEVPDQRARRVAADHGVWVVMASFAGSTGGGFDQSAGCSEIWRPDGSAAARVGPEPGAIAQTLISPGQPSTMD